ncbi:MAG: sce7726 family protein [Candidatus Nanopelagicales bacterium]
MRDIDVRQALVAAVARRVGTQPHVLVPEVDVRWTVPARMDALLVADRISGFEIKSDVDSLTRLPRQIEAYGAVVERAVLVVGDRHLASGTEVVPPWWTIWGARWRDNEVVIREVRRGRLNPDLNPLAVTSFMSRDDLSEALRARGFTRLSTYSADELRQLLASNVSPRETVRLARSAMLGNALWRHRSLLAA